MSRLGDFFRRVFELSIRSRIGCLKGPGSSESIHETHMSGTVGPLGRGVRMHLRRGESTREVILSADERGFGWRAATKAQRLRGHETEFPHSFHEVVSATSQRHRIAMSNST